MPDSSQANDVVSYASAVRAALEPLPEAQRESLLEDLETEGVPLLAERGVEHDHQLAEAEHVEGEPAPAVGVRRWK